MSATAMPPSSPRLPSPPPPAENQIGPQSPSMGPNAGLQLQPIEQTQIDAAAKRRIHPGTKSADMAAGPPLVPLNELDSAFQLQEHLSALHYYHTAGNTTPITRETAQMLTNPPPSIDRTLWLYELCRFLVKQCNSLIVGFLFDTPPCSAATCPEMRASEWQFLCAVHDTPKSCCAIDYCCHTLDWAANVVTNPKTFPSRFVVMSDGHDRGTALKGLVNVFRRLHRVFAHAWFQHRGVFWSVEGQTGLYAFFKMVCDLYDLLPAENYKLPPEAEGLETSVAPRGVEIDASAEEWSENQQQRPIVTAVARPAPQRQSLDDESQGMGRSNTRRHIRSNPSTGNAVATVPEVDEDDSGALANKLRSMRISASQAAEPRPEPETEETEVPVIVMEDAPAQPHARRRMSPQTSAKEVEPEPGDEHAFPTPMTALHDAAEIQPALQEPTPTPDVRAQEPPPTMELPEMAKEKAREEEEVAAKGEDAEAENQGASAATAPDPTGEHAGGEEEGHSLEKEEEEEEEEEKEAAAATSPDVGGGLPQADEGVDGPTPAPKETAAGAEAAVASGEDAAVTPGPEAAADQEGQKAE